MACVAENNIPVVGKEMVFNNREMHWLRIDRYFKAEGEDYEQQIRDPNPDVILQPMMCVHCENAPCEQVCPVAATVHDTEGLNVMVYNRCIGTRYCSNNCPYKVRKFNYLDWWAKDPRRPTHDATFIGPPDQQQQTIDAIKRMVFNPEVTVRMRGVMEKCTYCIQRIKLKTNWRRNRDEELEDGDIKTACQMACPTESIVFGDLNDRGARVTHQQKLPRAYAVLDDLNTRPRTKHLAKLRHRAPVASAAEASGH
jgi:molybdopterin-containing oxidoreductase family iron-sulfur binding subunit